MPVFKGACVVLLLISAWACGGNSMPTAPSTPATPTRIIGLSGNLAFGSVMVGQSATATLTITNSGNSTLTVSGMTITGGLETVFSPSWTSGTIAAGGSQQVTARFAPTVAQSYSGIVTVNGDQTSGTNTIAISAAGVVPAPAPAPTPTYSWALDTGTLEFCTATLCLDFSGSARNLGTGCATNLWFHVEFYTLEFGNILPDILVFPANSKATTMTVRPGQTVSFKTDAVFNTLGRHITGWLVTPNYTPVSCQ
jgi:hypothetical protein